MESNQESNSAWQKQIALTRPTQGVLLPILLARLSTLGPIKKLTEHLVCVATLE